MKNNISYYRHETYAHNHWKFKTLRRKFGWAGEGRFWALNNMISDSENCQLDVQDKSQIESIASDIDLSVEEFIAFITFLKDTVRLIKQAGGLITTDIVQESLQEVQKKREYQRNWAKHKSNIEIGNQSIETTESNIESEISNIENEQSKVKESKVKESKVNKNTGAAEIVCKFLSEDFKKAWQEWAEYRIEIRHSLKPQTIKKQISFLEKFPEETVIEILNQSIRNGWQGLFPLKIEQNGAKKLNKSEQRLEDYKEFVNRRPGNN